jgi:hypothetical protein
MLVITLAHLALLTPPPVQTALMDWLAALPGGELGPVTLAPSSVGAGVGCYATRNVEGGELLLAVPESACVRLDAVTLRQPLGTNAADREDIALYLAHRRLSGGGDHPYLDSTILPWNEVDQEHVIWWSESEIELLRGCTAHARATTMHEEVSRTVRRLRREMPDVSEEEAASAVRGAFVSLYSRAFGYGDTWLVPVLDGLNHESVSNVVHFLEPWQSEGEASKKSPSPPPHQHQQQRIVLRANKQIAAGEEVALTYGAGPDYDFGCEYGFIDLGGMAHPGDPAAWTASGIQRRSSCCAAIAVGGLEFDVSLKQLDFLRMTAAGMSLQNAANRGGLGELVSCAELSALASPECDDAPSLLEHIASGRLQELRAGRLAAAELQAGLQGQDVHTGRAALAEKLRRSEELALEELEGAMARCSS